MLFETGIRWDRNTAGIYATLSYNGGYWDFQALTVSATLTSGCKVGLTELSDGSPLSWYYGGFRVPAGGPYAVQICLADGTRIGDDITPAPSAPAAPVVSGRTLTREQFAIKVLSTLAAYDRSTPDAEDTQNVLDAYDAVYQELKDDGLVTWTQNGEEEAIPIRFVNPLVALVASTPVLLGSYPQPAARMQALVLAGSAAKNQIRRQFASAQGTETTVMEYF